VLNHKIYREVHMKDRIRYQICFRTLVLVSWYDCLKGAGCPHNTDDRKQYVPGELDFLNNRS